MLQLGSKAKSASSYFFFNFPNVKLPVHYNQGHAIIMQIRYYLLHLAVNFCAASIFLRKPCDRCFFGLARVQNYDRMPKRANTDKPALQAKDTLLPDSIGNATHSTICRKYRIYLVLKHTPFPKIRELPAPYR